MPDKDGKALCPHCFAPVEPGEVCAACGGVGNADQYPSALPEGTMLADRYTVGMVLGKGGFGVTYLCYDSVEQKRVCIKEYLPDALTHRNTGKADVSIYGGEREQYFQTGAEKFLEEAKTIARFNGNPNVINVYTSFRENQTAYYVMEYLEGCDLKKYIAHSGGSLPEQETMKIFRAMIDALIIVHSMDVLHRDISPDNIFICNDGKIKLLDFGAARQMVGDGADGLSVILKQGFAPIEQYQKTGRQGYWTDIYSLGATLYYALTGRLIDDAMTRLNDPTLDMSGIAPDLAALLQKMMQPQSADRFQNIFEVKQAFSDMLRNRAENGDAPAPTKNKFGGLIAVITVLIVTLVSAVVILLIRDTKQKATPAVGTQASQTTQGVGNTEPETTAVQTTGSASEEKSEPDTSTAESPTDTDESSEPEPVSQIDPSDPDYPILIDPTLFDPLIDADTTTTKANAKKSDKWNLTCGVNFKQTTYSDSMSKINPYGYFYFNYTMHGPSGKEIYVSHEIYVKHKDGSETMEGSLVNDLAMKDGDTNSIWFYLSFPDTFEDGDVMVMRFYNHATAESIGEKTVTLSRSAPFRAKVVGQSAMFYETKTGAEHLLAPGEVMSFSKVVGEKAYTQFEGKSGYVLVQYLTASEQ